MKKLLLALLVIFIPQSLIAEEIQVIVRGMVCSFCAQGLKNSFSELPEVKEVTPNLEKSTVVVTTKDGQTLSDEKIKEIVLDAGYETAAIERKTF